MYKNTKSIIFTESTESTEGTESTESTKSTDDTFLRDHLWRHFEEQF